MLVSVRLKVEMLTRIAERIPWAILRRLVARVTRGKHLAFCLHRVSKHRRPGELLPSLTVPEAVLDEFIEQMLVGRSASQGRPWLTMAFDDGYADAVDYVASRASKYRDIEWLLFVCPHKVRMRQGFRWDDYEKRLRQGEALPHHDTYIHELCLDYRSELKRADLKAIATEPRFELATEQQLIGAAKLENVSLGNHTNSHLLGSLPLHQALEDLEESTHQFEEMFGPCQHFAFPFGVPGTHFRGAHVRHLRSLRSMLMWTTEQLLYLPEERRPGAVLPRVVFNGTWSAKTMALWVALRAQRGCGSEALLGPCSQPTSGVRNSLRE